MRNAAAVSVAVLALVSVVIAIFVAWRSSTPHESGHGDKPHRHNQSEHSSRAIAAPSAHHVAWVRCVSDGERGDDALVGQEDADGDRGFKASWLACRESAEK